MKNSDILIAARAKIEKPEHWTQGVFARNVNGVAVNTLSDNAVCFCAVGAVKSISMLTDERNNPLYYIDVLLLKYDSIEKFNDTSSHQDVIKMFDKAILLAKAEEE